VARLAATRVAVLAALLAPMVRPAAAQTVQGRVLQPPQATPIAGALVVLVDSAGRDLSRAASSATGGFVLAAGRPGRYSVAVRQIGWKTWRSESFELAAGQTYPLVLRVEAEPYALQTITVEAKQPRCGIRIGGDELVSHLLEVAQTALALAQATADAGELAFSSERYLARYTPKLELADSGDMGAGPLASWPVQTAPPDSIRRWGFVRTDRPGQGWTDVGVDRGPVYYGLDARVLFSDWFLTSHCFRLEEEKEGELRVGFAPERRGPVTDVEGSLALERSTLELRRIAFTYVNLPRWVPRKRAGGEVRLRRLRSGAWVPYAWRIRAPVPRLTLGGAQPSVDEWVETGGQVRSVRGPSGEVDSALTRELLEGR
jgi:Carboxypeptidase regulatory-like domain